MPDDLKITPKDLKHVNTKSRCKPDSKVAVNTRKESTDSFHLEYLSSDKSSDDSRHKIISNENKNLVISDSDSTFLELTDNEDDFFNCSNRESNDAKIEFNKDPISAVRNLLVRRNDEDLSTPSSGKTHRVSSKKTLFSNKKQYNLLTVMADVHHARESESGSLNESSFVPPHSSTKIVHTRDSIRTPVSVNRNANKSDLEMSGVKELNSPLIQDDVVSSPVSRRPGGMSRLNQDANLDDDDDDDLPPTQPVSSIILNGVVAYVDVRIGKMSCSNSVKIQLELHGAQVLSSFTKKVTLVVFKDGFLSTFKRAKLWNIPMVCTLWIEACKSALSIAPYEKYPPINLENYEVALKKHDMNKELRDLARKRMEEQLNIKVLPKKLNSGKKKATPSKSTEKSEDDVNKLLLDNMAEDVKKFLLCSESPSFSEDFYVPVSARLLRKVLSPRRAKTNTKKKPMKILNKNTAGTKNRRKLDNAFKDEGIPNDKNGKCNIEKRKGPMARVEDAEGERRSAPARILDHPEKKNNNFDNKENEVIVAKPGPSKVPDDEIMKSQPPTQTKRKLLQIEGTDYLENEDQLNSSATDVINVINPYNSPKRVRKVSPRTRTGLRSEKKVVRRTNESQNSRRSSIFFCPKTRSGKRARQTTTVVCTGLKRDQVDTVAAIVDSLGIYEIEKNVSSRTSHVVVFHKNYRTINLLKGICRGCWIVHMDWVLASLEAGKWIHEEPYEHKSFSPAIKINRKDRQAFGQEFSSDLFSKSRPFFIVRTTNPPAKDIKELIELCGGKIVTYTRPAGLIIGGQFSSKDRVPRVSEKWILDCITQNKILDFLSYHIQESDNEL